MLVKHSKEESLLLTPKILLPSIRIKLRNLELIKLMLISLLVELKGIRMTPQDGILVQFWASL